LPFQAKGQIEKFLLTYKFSPWCTPLLIQVLYPFRPTHPLNHIFSYYSFELINEIECIIVVSENESLLATHYLTIQSLTLFNLCYVKSILNLLTSLIV